MITQDAHGVETRDNARLMRINKTYERGMKRWCNLSKKSAEANNVKGALQWDGYGSSADADLEGTG